MSNYDTQAAKIKRQRAIADALRASGNEALPPSLQTSGRFDAPVSGWQYANKALSQVLGAYQNRKADQAEKKLSEDDSAELANVIAAKRLADTQENQAPDASNAQDLTEVPTLPKVNGKAAMQAAALRGQQYGGQAGDVSGEILKRELFPTEDKEHVLGYGDVLYDKKNRPVAMGQERSVTQPAEDRAAMEFVASTVPDATPGELAAGRATRPRSALQPGMIQYHPPTGGGSGEGLPSDYEPMTEDAKRNAALDTIRDPDRIRQYAQGNSKIAQADRHGINNLAAKIMKDTGLTNNQVAQFRARVAGEVKSQKGLVEMSNAVQSYEKLAKFNGDRLLQLIDGVDTTGVPAIEGAIRHVKAKGGNVDTAEFQSVLNQYQTEVARVVNQPRLVGQLTDTQIAEMRKVVDGSASAPQLRRVINRLGLEMDMRGRFVEEQIKSSGSRLAIPGVDASETPPAAANSPAAAGPVKIASDEEFNKLPPGTEFVGPDGVHRKKP